MIKTILNHHRIKHFNIAITTIGWVILLILIKYLIHFFKWEFLEINTLTGSAIAGATFICGFLLSGLITDYKEAEKIPSELRASLENIFEEGQLFKKGKTTFKILRLKETLKKVISNFFLGISHEQNHINLKPCLQSIDELSQHFYEMEQLGMPPNYLVRLKTEQGNIRRSVLRVLHIQRTQFIPSAYILGQSIVCLIVFLLLFIKSEGSPESFVLFGFISYMFLYIVRLITKIEQPFQEGEFSRDDVSLFLLHDFEDKLKN